MQHAKMKLWRVGVLLVALCGSVMAEGQIPWMPGPGNPYWEKLVSRARNNPAKINAVSLEILDRLKTDFAWMSDGEQALRALRQVEQVRVQSGARPSEKVIQLFDSLADKSKGNRFHLIGLYEKQILLGARPEELVKTLHSALLWPKLDISWDSGLPEGSKLGVHLESTAYRYAVELRRDHPHLRSDLFAMFDDLKKNHRSFGRSLDGLSRSYFEEHASRGPIQICTDYFRALIPR